MTDRALDRNRMARIKADAEITRTLRSRMGEPWVCFIGRARPAEGPVPIVIPLAAIYGREKSREAKRTAMYTEIARQYGAKNSPWLKGAKTAPEPKKKKPEAKRDQPALEHLSDRGLLGDSGEWSGASSAGNRRWEAALRFRADVEISGAILRSPDWASVGGGASGGRLPGDAKVDAMRSLGAIRTSLTADLYEMVRGVLIDDRRPWEARNRAVRGEVLDQIRYALDVAAVHYRLAPPAHLAQRWPGR